jgi:serine/threonine-protein kinase RsbW
LSPVDDQMGTLKTDIRRDADSDVTVLTVSGTLDGQSQPALWAVLEKCWADYPIGILVDLERAHVPDPVWLTIFPAAIAAHRLTMPDVAVLVCGQPELLTTGGVSVILGSHVVVVSSVNEGMVRAASVRQEKRPFIVDLPCSPAAPPTARQAVADAFACWRLETAFHEAKLIASELAANAYRHARTPSRLELIHRAAHVVLKLRDQSRELPISPPDRVAPTATSGRGLWLVSNQAAAWGYIPEPEGKTVWATVRVAHV